MDSINYDGLIQSALRDVVRRALKQVFDNGLPGNHHFYITFRTDRADVQMPEKLRREHPSEVTIVMQHQFWDLEVEDLYFAVTLSFNGRRERLKVPYNALISFMDPSVKFGLQFAPMPVMSSNDVERSELHTHNGASPSKKSNIVTLDTFRNNKKK